MTKEDSGNFKSSATCWIFNKDYVDNDVKVRDHCHFTGKYRGSVHNCNINLKVNHKVPIVFHNLNNYDSHLIMQELSQINLKISVIQNGLEKYMSFIINNRLSFIDSFQFRSSSLDSFIRKLNKDDFKYLVFKYFIIMCIWMILKSLKKNYLAKKSYIVCWLIEKLLTKNMNTILLLRKI